MHIFKLTIILSISVYLLGFIGSMPDPFASPIWPATGFQIAMYFRYGKKALLAMAPGVAIIMFQSGYTGGLGLISSVIFSFVGVTAMLSEAVLARYFTKPSNKSLDDEKSFLRFTFLGAPIGALSSSIQGVSVLLFFNAYPSSVETYIPYLVWFSGNIIGAYALVPLLTMKQEHLNSIKKYYKQIIAYCLIGMSIIYVGEYNFLADTTSSLFVILLIVAINFLIRLRQYAAIVVVLSFNTLYFIILHISNHTVQSEYFSLYDMIETQIYIAVILATSMIFFNQLKKNIQLAEKLKEQNIILEDLNENLEQQVEDEVEKSRKKDQQLLVQSRLAQMGEMISMIAHQWKQPLGAISSTSIDLQMKLMLNDYKNRDEKVREEFFNYTDTSLKQIDSFVANLATTIDDFRNFYKPNKKSVIVKLEDVVEKSLNIINQSLASDNIKIIEQFNSKKEIKLYDNEMMQVILNILKNAKDNFQEKQTKNPYIKITTEDNTISICDNGGGVAEDIIEKIFDPYFSTKDVKNGTGIGLYMSKTIVEIHHNGKLSVKNVDDGACFIIELGRISEIQKL